MQFRNYYKEPTYYEEPLTEEEKYANEEIDDLIEKINSDFIDEEDKYFKQLIGGDATMMSIFKNKKCNKCLYDCNQSINCRLNRLLKKVKK